MFDMLEKGEPVEGCKDRGDIVKKTGYVNNLCNSILNRYAQDKTREKDVAVSEM